MKRKRNGKRSGRGSWTREELQCGCSCHDFTKTETITLAPTAGANKRKFYQRVCRNCCTVFRKIPGQEGEVNKALSHHLKEQFRDGMKWR